MLKLKRTNSKNEDFIQLVHQLDAYLADIDGDEHDFYHQHNGIENLNNTIVAYWNEEAVGCGAFKKFDEKSIEIKRMYVHPNFRGKKIATEILIALEKWSQELGFEKCVLETGKRMKDAVAFYSKLKYVITPKFGPYKNIDNSLCFEKVLNRIG